MNEKQLIEACCKQQQKAQRVFFDRYYKEVFRLARRYLADFHEAEDITIVVFNKAFKYITSFEYRGEGSLKKWLNTITINESIRAIKKVRPMSYKAEIPEPASLPLQYQTLDTDLVYHILEKMPRGYRTVFNLYAIDGYTHSEIAETLNISRNTSKSQLLKARKFIIQELQKKQTYGT